MPGSMPPSPTSEEGPPGLPPVGEPSAPTAGQRAAYSLGSSVAAAWIVLLRLTMRVAWSGREHAEKLAAGDEGCLLAFWHEHLMIMRWAIIPRSCCLSD